MARRNDTKKDLIASGVTGLLYAGSDSFVKGDPMDSRLLKVAAESAGSDFLSNYATDYVYPMVTGKRVARGKEGMIATSAMSGVIFIGVDHFLKFDADKSLLYKFLAQAGASAASEYSADYIAALLR